MFHKVVLFDADGMTLLPKRFSEQIQKDYGIPREVMKSFFSGPFYRCKLGQADLREELASVVGVWGWKGSVDELMRYWFSVGATPNPEILVIIQELRSRGVACYLATNQEKYRAEYLRKVVGLGEVFDGLLVSAELGHTKNEVKFFEAAYERLSSSHGDLSKETVLFVDHEESNLAAAKEFGFNVFMYQDIQGFREVVYAV